MQNAKITLQPGATQPTRQHQTDAGYDLHAHKNTTIPPHSRTLVNTGVAIQLPENHVGLICPRSGLAHKKGVTVLNAPGIIDAGYRGEIKINLYNTTDQPVPIQAGDRIAQLVITTITTPTLTQVDTLDPSDRGTQGHGSTGQ